MDELDSELQREFVEEERRRLIVVDNRPMCLVHRAMCDPDCPYPPPHRIAGDLESNPECLR